MTTHDLLNLRCGRPVVSMVTGDGARHSNAYFLRECRNSPRTLRKPSGSSAIMKCLCLLKMDMEVRASQRTAHSRWECGRAAADRAADSSRRENFPTGFFGAPRRSCEGSRLREDPGRESWLHRWSSQHKGLYARRMFERQVLEDHAAHRYPDLHRLLDLQPIRQRDQVRYKLRNVGAGGSLLRIAIHSHGDRLQCRDRQGSRRPDIWGRCCWWSRRHGHRSPGRRSLLRGCVASRQPATES